MSKSKVTNLTLPVYLTDAIAWLSKVTGLSQSQIARLVLVPGVQQFAAEWSAQGPHAVAVATSRLAHVEAQYLNSLTQDSGSNPTPSWLQASPPPPPQAVALPAAPAAAPAPTPESKPEPGKFSRRAGEPERPKSCGRVNVIKNSAGHAWVTVKGVCEALGITTSQLEAKMDQEDYWVVGDIEYIDKVGFKTAMLLTPDAAAAEPARAWIQFQLDHPR